MRRRDFLLASAAFALAGSSRVAAQENGKPASIAVMTWGGQFGDAVAKGADREFESRFGIKVIQDRGSTPVERITKVKINEKNQIFDVMQLHDGLVPAFGRPAGRLRKAGFLIASALQCQVIDRQLR